jgi:hypothetical protein
VSGEGFTPGVHDASAYTQALRPPVRLDVERQDAARRLKRQHPEWTPAEIAAQVGAEEADVLLALATLRTRNPRPTRATLNLPLPAAAFVRAEAMPGETLGQAADRLLAELRQLRAAVGARYASKT